MPAAIVAAVVAATNPSCHATRCRNRGCSLSLSGAPQPSLLIDMEQDAAPVTSGQPHCDYLFVGGNDESGGPWVAPIELTTGRKRASEFLAQLCAGAAVADKLLPPAIRFRFRPVAVLTPLRAGGCAIARLIFVGGKLRLKWQNAARVWPKALIGSVPGSVPF